MKAKKSLRMSNYLFGTTNEYEEFVAKVTSDTRSKKIHWEPLRLTSVVSKFIVNQEKIVRGYRAALKDKYRTLFAIEKKIPEYSTDLDDYYDVLSPELYVIHKDNLELLLDKELVAEHLLSDLVEAASRQAAKTEQFLKEFLESD